MPNILKTLAKLLTDFKNCNNVTPVDFVEGLLRERSISQNEGQHFLHLAKHELFLQQVANDFLDRHKLRRVSKINVEVLVYFITFSLNETNYFTLFNVNMFYINQLLMYMLEESSHLLLAKVACKMFENDYVLEKIMYPLLDKQQLLEAVLEKIEEDESNKIVKKDITVPQEFECFKRVYKKSPAPPLNTPDGSIRVRSKFRKPRKSLDGRFSRKLKEEFEKNRERARSLLVEAQKTPYRLVEPRRPKPPLQIKNQIFKANKIPHNKPVEIKGNLATTLREASRLMKAQEEEIRKIEEIIKGGSNAEALEQIEMDQRREKQQKELEDIERKHLQSLITYEESILAKRRLLQKNREKMRQVKEAKMELAKKLEQWRKEEQEKIKAFVEKGHKIKEDARESGKKLHEERQDQVRIQQYETKELLKKMYEEQKEELARKMKLIEEIRTLHQIRVNMNVKEFDPTECPNLGLMCEMSIAELQERLSMAKIKMKEELDEKRKGILKRKERQQEMLENVKNFITQTRLMSKPQPLPITTVNLERSPDLDELRRKLEEKRDLRMKIKKKKKYA